MSRSYIIRPKFNSGEYVPIEYRFYYDSLTHIGIYKSCEYVDETLPSIVISREQYDEIDFCNKFKVKDNKIEKIFADHSVLKYCLSSGGKIRTVKNNMLFLIKDDRSEYDVWNLK